MTEQILATTVLGWDDLNVRPLDLETVDRYAEDIETILREAPPFSFALP